MMRRPTSVTWVLPLVLAGIVLALTTASQAPGAARSPQALHPAFGTENVQPGTPPGAAAAPGGRGPHVAEPRPRVPGTAASGASIAGLHVRGNRILNKDGRDVRLLGFNNAGAEYACIEGWGIFDAPQSQLTKISSARVRVMATWIGANTVRLPLNEQCWLGLGVKRAYGGARYRAAIHDYVSLLNEHGFIVVLDLHRSAPANGRSLKQEQMPDRDHSPTFWREVAAAYKVNTSVIFDVFNEPWPYGDVNSPRAWQCWRDGGCRLRSENTGQTYTAAGMNELVAAIRSTGARNILAVGGIHWAETLDSWLARRPADPLGNLVASFHNYSYNRYCDDDACYDTVLAQVSATVPLYAGEVGPDLVDAKCTPASVGHTGFSERILDWLDRHSASYTPFSWNAWKDCYSLIGSDSGDPTPIWGKQVKARLAAKAP
jgi:endoglucanase